MSRASRFAPLILLGLLIAGLIWRLATPADTIVSSKLQGKAVPYFPPMAASQTKMAFGSGDLASGKPHLLNFFASWCGPCVEEVRVLKTLKDRGVMIDGVAVRDRPEDVDVFLARNGDPYQAVTADSQSDIQISLGSSGVPETFVVDGKGIVRYQHIGAIKASDAALILEKLEQAK